MAGLFPRDSVIRRVDAELALLLGGGRAVLMQLAHPQVAAGVADHSNFEADPFGRLGGTLNAVFTIVYGTEDQARGMADRLRRIHDRVSGPGYQANDPALLLWVHATLVDTALRIHTRFLAPLSDDDQRTYYDDSMTVAELLGVPRSFQPPDLPSFRAYVRGMVGRLEVTDDARRVAAAVLHPRLPVVAAPLVALVRQVTVGLLPAPLRLQYGLDWNGRRQLALLAAQASARQVLPRLPRPLRQAPAATFAA